MLAGQRLGLGCMRLSTEADRDEGRALATLAAALAAGIRLFDTARAYALGEEDLGHNERLVGRALAGTGALVATKGGMSREGGRWVPDGRARTLRDDCAASREALGRPIDLYLLHAPDPRVPLATSVRALLDLREAGWVRGIGLCNVSRTQLDEALGIGPLDAVQVALGAHADEAARGGVLVRCRERGIAVLAHSPLGGPARAKRLARRPELAREAARLGVSPAVLLLAWLADLGATPLPGATHLGTVEDCALATRLGLDDAARATLAACFPGLAPTPAPVAANPERGEVVVLMGIPGAGKTRAVAEWVARGHERLNRDEVGGTLRGIHRRLDERLAAGVRRLVLDNTYTTRAPRHDVVAIAARHGLPVRCVWLDTPPAEAQVNVVQRMLARHGRLLAPDELRNHPDPNMLAPTAHARHVRSLEPPAPDEGFASIDVVPFERAPGSGVPGVFVADALPSPERLAELAPPGTPIMLFGWRPDGSAPDSPYPSAFCPHGAGPPVCWCRPPLPGLPLWLAYQAGVDPRRSLLVGASAAHRTLAAAIGATLVTP